MLRWNRPARLWRDAFDSRRNLPIDKPPREAEHPVPHPGCGVYLALGGMEVHMNVQQYLSGFSTPGLQMMHKAVRDAFDKDEATPQGQQKPYGVRHYADWRQWSDALEAVLESRGAPFTPIPWGP